MGEAPSIRGRRASVELALLTRPAILRTEGHGMERKSAARRLFSITMAVLSTLFPGPLNAALEASPAQPPAATGHRAPNWNRFPSPT